MQRVLLDGFYSTWEITRAGVPQGSVLGPLLFLVFINDITENIQSHVKLFADDTMLYLDVEDHTKAAQILNQDLQNIYAWSQKWLVNFNAKKTESLTFTTKTVKQQHPPLFLHTTAIAEVNSHTHLGLTLSSDGKWEKQITNMISKTNYKLAALHKLKNSLDRHTLSGIYTSYIRPTMEYASIVWNNCTLLQSNRLEQLQLEASRIVTGSVKGTKHKYLYKETGWLPLADRRHIFQLILMCKMMNQLVPRYLSLLISRPRQQNYNLRNELNIPTILATNNLYKNSFLPSTISQWNKLSNDIKLSTSPNSLKWALNKSLNPNKKPPNYFNTGSRKGQILLARLRMETSNLNDHMVKRYLQDNPSCDCGAQAETPSHYLLSCPKFTIERTIMLNNLPNTTLPINVDTVDSLKSAGLKFHVFSI